MKTHWLKLKKSFKKNKPLFGLLFLIVVLPLIIILAQTITKLGSKAAPPPAPQSYLMFEPKTDKTIFGIGEEFEIDVVLDSKTDSMTIAGADILINYPQQLKPIAVTPGNVFVSLTQQHINDKRISLSVADQNIKNDQGYPDGFNDRGNIATLKFKVISQGKGSLDFIYQNTSSTSDTNVIGFDKAKLVSQQIPKERLLKKPGGWQFEAKQALPSPSPAPSKTPYPSYTATPSASPKPTPWPSPWLPSPSPSPQPRPKAQLQLQLTMLGRNKGIAEDDYSTTGILYGINAGQVKGVMIASQFGDMIEENEQKKVSIEYAKPSSEEMKKFPTPELPESRANLIKLASFNADKYGRATVEINEDYEGQKMFLFVQTPSHLLKASEQAVTVPQIPSCLPNCEVAIQIPTVKFNNLIPGDIYLAEGQTRQDNKINSFDALELIRNLGQTAKIAMSDVQCFKAPCSPPPSTIHYHEADLNIDEIVNVRDLKILLTYLGQTGDSFQAQPQNTTYCQTDKDCSEGLKCYQPPMPECPEGFGCIQVMPQKYCRQWGN